MKRLLLLILAASGTLVSPALAQNDWPAISTQIIELGDYSQNNNEGCRNHALSVISGLSLSHIGVTGSNLTYGVFTIEGRDYALTVRCQVEHKIVFFAIAGPLASNAHKAMLLFQEAWNPKTLPEEVTGKPPA